MAIVNCKQQKFYITDCEFIDFYCVSLAYISTHLHKSYFIK